MNKLIHILFVSLLLSLTLVSCDDNDDPITTISTSGNVKGTIAGADTLGFIVDSVVCNLFVNSSNIIVGSGKFKNGVFNFNLQTPPLAFLTPFLSSRFISHGASNSTNNIISDSTVNASLNVEFLVYNGSNCIGSMIRTNMSSDELLINPPEVGWAVAMYTYADGDVAYQAIDTTNYFSNRPNYVFDYDIKLKKGWNEIIVQVKNVSEDNIDISYRTNIQPSGMVWMLDFPYMDEYSVVTKSATFISTNRWWESGAFLKK